MYKAQHMTTFVDTEYADPQLRGCIKTAACDTLIVQITAKVYIAFLVCAGSWQPQRHMAGTEQADKLAFDIYRQLKRLMNVRIRESALLILLLSGHLKAQCNPVLEHRYCHAALCMHTV